MSQSDPSPSPILRLLDEKQKHDVATIADLAAQLSPHEVSYAFGQAYTNGLADVLAVLLPQVSDLQRGHAFMVASELGHTQCVRMLMGDIGFSQTQNNNALSRAATMGHTDIVELLLPVSNARDNDSHPLQMAARYGHVECVRLLLPHSDPKVSSCLCWAAEFGHIDVVRLLLPVGDPKANDSEALVLAAENGHSAIAKLLIPVSDPKADGSAALMWACIQNNEECIDLLWDVSNPLQALDAIKATYPGQPQKWHFLEQRIQANTQNKVLHNTVPKAHTPTNAQRKI